MTADPRQPTEPRAPSLDGLAEDRENASREAAPTFVGYRDDAGDVVQARVIRCDAAGDRLELDVRFGEEVGPDIRLGERHGSGWKTSPEPPENQLLPPEHAARPVRRVGREWMRERPGQRCRCTIVGDGSVACVPNWAQVGGRTTTTKNCSEVVWVRTA